MHKLALLYAYKQHCAGLRQRWQEDNRVLLHSPIHLTTQTINWRNKTKAKDGANDSGWATPSQTGDCSPINSWKHTPEQYTREAVCSKGSALLRACWHTVYSWWLTTPISFSGRWQSESRIQILIISSHLFSCIIISQGVHNTISWNTGNSSVSKM